MKAEIPHRSETAAASGVPDLRRAEVCLFMLLVLLLGSVLMATAGGPKGVLRMTTSLWLRDAARATYVS